MSPVRNFTSSIFRLKISLAGNRISYMKINIVNF